MRVGSYDVGINHLACCIVSRKDETSVPKIKDWYLIALFSENEKIECNGFNKGNGVSCDKNASFISTVDCDEGSVYHYCGHHKPNDIVCTEIKRVNTKNVSNTKLYTRLREALDKIDLSKCDKIVIEHQPRRATERMQSIAHAIFYDCVERYYNDPDSKCKSVMYAPRDKFKFYNGPYLDSKIIIPKGTKGKKLQRMLYEKRKERAILITEYLLEHYNVDQNLKDYFYKNRSKKDDLADSFIQGLSVLLQ